jgi:hypothetical protein
MARPIKDFTGVTFGDQEVMGFSHKKNGNHFWNVKCSCGNVRPLQLATLKAGKSKSCGCKTLSVTPGREFGRLTVVRKLQRTSGGHIEWECKCVCGKLVPVSNSNLTSGRTQSCGCYKTDTLKERAIHGKEGTRLYRILENMMARCNNPKNHKYKDYGDRGIYVCKKWLQNKSAFFEWAESNGYSNNLQIDRKDNNGPYSPENCRWVTSKTNNQNRRDNSHITFKGRTLLLSEWASLLNIKESTIRTRKDRRYSEEDILSPLHRRTGKRLSV